MSKPEWSIWHGWTYPQVPEKTALAHTNDLETLFPKVWELKFEGSSEQIRTDIGKLVSRLAQLQKDLSV